MPRPLVLALDQGTTSSRGIVFDRSGNPRGIAQQEFAQSYPKPGWVEHNPDTLWDTTRRVALAAVAEANIRGTDLTAVGITNQRETTLLWERKTGRPLAHAIVWQDRRTANACAKLKHRGLEPLFRKRSGLLLDPYFSGTKLAWLLDNIPGARRRANRGELAFGTVDTWLLWKLTSGRIHATDVSNASRTLLLNLRTGDWDDELLAALRIPRELLPQVCSSSEVYGEIDSIPALRGVPIAGIAGDQQAALFGQACYSAGSAKSTYGTGCFLLLHTGTKPVQSRQNLLTTVAWRVGADGPLEYALEGSVFIGGAVVQWLRDGLGIIDKSAAIEALANSVENNGGVYLVPAFAGLGAPHWDPNARGLLIGLTRGTTSAHIARAALESIAYQSADLIRAMQDDAGIALRDLRVDGGATVNDTLLQFQSDLLGLRVMRPRITETTALGAAYLAGLATGVWRDRKEVAALQGKPTIFTPRVPRSRMKAMYSAWQRAVKRSKSWLE